MPAPASAAAAPPPTSSLRVRRTSGRLWLDAHEIAEHALEVADHAGVRRRRRHVLADRVEGPVLFPGVEHVPLVGAAVARVDRDVETGDPLRVLRVREARQVLAPRL